MKELQENTSSIEEALHGLFRLVKRSHHGGKHGHHGSHRRSGGRFLQIVAANEGVTSTELAEKLDIRPGSLSEKLGKMEAAGLIERIKDEADQRIVHISLTEAGKDQLQETREKPEDIFGGILAVDEEATFITLAHKLKAGLAEKITQELTTHPCTCGRVDGPCICGKYDNAGEGREKPHGKHGGRGGRGGR